MTTAVALASACVIAGLWYWFAVRLNRRRAVEVLRWIEGALDGQGHVVGIRWITPSRFLVPLRLASGFRQAAVMVQLPPLEMPFQWLAAKLHKQEETLTFQADLEFPPSFSLEVQNHRWFARTDKDLKPNGKGWNFEQSGPFVLTTRMDWQREMSGVVNSLVSCRAKEFHNVVFRKDSPHFSATVPLDSISPNALCRYEVFSSLRELATAASEANSY